MSPSLHRSIPFLLAVCCGVAQGRDGDLDPGFSGDGTLTIDTGNRVYDVHLAPTSDGDIFVAGSLRRANFNYDPTVVKVRDDGTLNPEFGMLGGTNVTIDIIEDGEDRLLDLFPLDDGKLLLVGTAELDEATDETALMLVRLDEGGDRDEGFGDDGVLLLPGNPWAAPEATLELHGVTRQADGALLVSGVVTGDLEESVVPRIVLRRIGIDGTPDTGFGEDGWVSIETDESYRVEAPRLDAQGRIVIGATLMTPFVGGTGAHVYRFTPQGALDTTFGAGSGRVVLPDDSTSNGVAAIEIDREGSILVAVYGSDLFDPHNMVAIHRVLPGGGLDASFGEEGALVLDLEDGIGISAMQVRSDGRIVLAGYIDHTGGTRDVFAARALRNGTLDPGFDGNGVARFAMDAAADDAAHAVLLSAGRPVLAGVAGEDSESLAVLRLASDWVFGDGLE